MNTTMPVKVLVLILAVLSISHVQSYSSVGVENDASISFTSSENSLIAMPKDINVEIGSLSADIQQPQETSYLLDLPATSEVTSSNFILTNNTENIISVRAFIKPPAEGIEIDNNDLVTGIFPGESYDMKFLLTEGLPFGEMRYTALIYAEWENGNAEIEKDFTVNVQLPPEILIVPQVIPEADSAAASSSGSGELNFEQSILAEDIQDNGLIQEGKESEKEPESPVVKDEGFVKEDAASDDKNNDAVTDDKNNDAVTENIKEKDIKERDLSEKEEVKTDEIIDGNDQKNVTDVTD